MFRARVSTGRDVWLLSPGPVSVMSPVSAAVICILGPRRRETKRKGANTGGASQQLQLDLSATSVRTARRAPTIASGRRHHIAARPALIDEGWRAFPARCVSHGGSRRRLPDQHGARRAVAGLPVQQLHRRDSFPNVEVFSNEARCAPVTNGNPSCANRQAWVYDGALLHGNCAAGLLGRQLVSAERGIFYLV